MHEDEIRAMVREAVARHIAEPSATTERARGIPAWKAHLSHGRFVFLAPSEPDAPCIVEPQVRCHHCGFCQSYGH